DPLHFCGPPSVDSVCICCRVDMYCTLLLFPGCISRSFPVSSHQWASATSFLLHLQRCLHPIPTLFHKVLQTALLGVQNPRVLSKTKQFRNSVFPIFCSQ